MSTPCHTLKNASSNVSIYHEGNVKVAGVAIVNFVGSGVSVMASGSNATVSIQQLRPVSWVWNADKEGGAVLGFSDGSTLIIPPMPTGPCAL
jgi:hypothetical protein